MKMPRLKKIKVAKMTPGYMLPHGWSSINRVARGKGMLKGCWLVDPDGNKVATIMDGALCGQIAAAMNLTTSKQRTDFSAERAGYGKAKRRGVSTREIAAASGKPVNFLTALTAKPRKFKG